MKKFGAAFLATTLMLTTVVLSPVSASAKESQPSQPHNMKIISVHETKGNPNAKVTFVKPTTKSVTPKGVISEEYDHSYYVVDSNTITGYNIGPISNQTFLVSVARGSTKTLSSAITVSGTVSITGSVSGGIKDVINMSLTSNVSGTVSYTYNTTDVYTGPDSPYNHRDYYAALQYDQYSSLVHTYDVYRVYNGSAYMYNTTYDMGTASYPSKKPKNISYSYDFTN